MSEENINQEFRLKNRLNKELFNQGNISKWINEEEHKKGCRVSNFIDNLLILLSTIIGCVYISAFPSLVRIPMGITSSAIGIKLWAITAGIKKYKSIIKKKKKKHDKIVLLAKCKLNSVEVSIPKALTDSNISYDVFILINYVLKEFYNIKEEIKNSNGK